MWEFSPNTCSEGIFQEIEKNITLGLLGFQINSNIKFLEWKILDVEFILPYWIMLKAETYFCYKDVPHIAFEKGLKWFFFLLWILLVLRACLGYMKQPCDISHMKIEHFLNMGLYQSWKSRIQISSLESLLMLSWVVVTQFLKSSCSVNGS